jgi:pimeloyl-ACP methyl ester carboxylesterase
MPQPTRRRRWGLPLLAAALVLPLALLTASAGPAEAAAKTSAKEAKRVDRVKTPKITWVENAALGGYTGTVRVPLDYDQPNGSKVTLALFKVPAADPAHRIGTLFVNPGGPGGSGVEAVEGAREFLSQSVLDRFDIVGFDPRGTNNSTRVTCFSTTSAQATVLNGMGETFPNSAQQSSFIAASRKLAKACAGKSLAASMSTAEVARDMDVLRRAVGDKLLTYLGFSYGSYLGVVYANLFPNRFRAITIDGVFDPVAWAGTSVTKSLPASNRIASGDAAWNALTAGLAACRDAGAACPLADPQADFDAVATALKKAPLRFVQGGDTVTLTYQEFVSQVLGLLYYPEGMNYVAPFVAALKQLMGSGDAGTVASAGTRAAALLRSFRKAGLQASMSSSHSYDNSLEAYSAVQCTDSYQPKSSSAWVSAVSKAAARAPYFSELWGWTDVQCSTDYWKAKDEDAYHGTFSTSTVAPVLVIGNYHDPATNYSGAVAASILMPNSVLLRSDSWGHTAYGTSDCVTDRADSYLLTGTVPSGTAETVCTGDVQPFQGAASTSAGTGSGLRVPSRAGLLPVRIPWLLPTS